MTDYNDFKIFKDNIVFSPWIQLPKNDWSILEPLGNKKFYKRNFIIYNCNEFSDYVYIVDSGRVELYIVDSEGNKKVIGICDKGSLFGELQLFDGKPNYCTARICRDAWVFEIQKNVFMDAILSNNDLMLSNLYNLTTKMRILYTQVEYLSFKPAEAKVALMFISMCKDFGVKLNNNEYKLNITFTHSDIANMTGLSRVTVSNTIMNLTNQGIIRKEGSEYFICDIGYLKKLVG
ncbi:MAG: Crp/Fnr family transcriptional regulator [Firmicutes bacterium]|nr:Crp/Fnr family transcriptional regulator [Bacillota bacterium]